MTWFRVDDGFADHPKVIALQARREGKGALALWTLAGAWSSKHLTDGHVPGPVVARLGGTKGEAEALVSVGLWERAEDGYRFHDWHDRNPTRERVEEKREAVRQRVAKHREKRSGNDASNASGNALQTQPVTKQVTPPPTRPDPTRPINLVPDGTRSSPAEPAPPLGARIRELESRYPADLIAAAREGCALSRKTGRVADSVWAQTLERLAALPAPAVLHALQTFVDKHADGDKGEAYLVGIARREAKGEGRGRRLDRQEPAVIVDRESARASVRAARDFFGEVANG